MINTVEKSNTTKGNISLSVDVLCTSEEVKERYSTSDLIDMLILAREHSSSSFQECRKVYAILKNAVENNDTNYSPAELKELKQENDKLYLNNLYARKQVEVINALLKKRFGVDDNVILSKPRLLKLKKIFDSFNKK